MAGKRRAQIELETARLRRPPGLDLLLERGHRGVHRLVEALAHTLHRVLKPTPQGRPTQCRGVCSSPREKSNDDRRSSRSESASRRWLVPVAVSDAVTKNCGLAGVGAAPSAEGGAGAPGPRASPLICQLAQHTRRGRRVCRQPEIFERARITSGAGCPRRCDARRRGMPDGHP